MQYANIVIKFSNLKNTAVQEKIERLKVHILKLFLTIRGVFLFSNRKYTIMFKSIGLFLYGIFETIAFEFSSRVILCLSVYSGYFGYWQFVLSYLVICLYYNLVTW